MRSEHQQEEMNNKKWDGQKKMKLDEIKKMLTRGGLHAKIAFCGAQDDEEREREKRDI